MLVHRDSQNDVGSLDVRTSLRLQETLLNEALATGRTAPVGARPDGVVLYAPLDPVTVDGRALWTDPRQ